MKKSLSLLLAIAMVFSAFASVASAATPATALEKFNVLKEAGIFSGRGANQDPALDENMTRAEYARVAGLLAGLDVDAEPSKQTFSDVGPDHWAYEEIEAAAAAGLVEGMGDGKFDPSGNVTVQQLAVIVVKVLGLNPVEGAQVEGADSWAGPYIQALINAGVNFPTNYKEAAKRSVLVEVSYTVYEAKQEPAQVSVVSAKPVGVKKVEVKLNKAVDTSKAKLTLKRGSATVATTTKWSDDKKSAILELDSTKIADADYTVTLSGLAADEIATASASFKGENERVVKIEFVTASDEIAQSTQARIKLRAENQYGEEASFNAASYTVSTDSVYNATIKQNSEGQLFVELDTTHSSLTPGLTQIPIYVYNNDNHVTASKTFKLGFTPFPSKLEIGEPIYSNGKGNISSTGDEVLFDLHVLDQYGNPITVNQQKAGGGLILTASSFNKNVTPYLNHNAGTDQEIDVVFEDDDNDEEYEAIIKLVKGIDKAQAHTITIYTGSASQSATFNVGSSKVVTSIDFEPYDGVIATGDAEAYIKLLAYDANGEQLTPSEIVDNKRRITISASGARSYELVEVGPHKGEIKLTDITASAKSYVFLTVSVLSVNTNSFKTYQIPVVDKRVPARIEVKEKPHEKAVLGATSDFEFIVKDQYGEEIKNADFDNTGSEQYRVWIEYNDGGSGTTITSPGTITINSGVPTSTQDFDAMNEEFTFNTVSNQVGKATLKVTLQKSTNALAPTPDWKDVFAPVSVSIETIRNDSKLTYSLEEVSSLYAAIDSELLPSTYTLGTDVDGPAKKLKLVVKDSGGKTVAYPKGFASVASSNLNVVQAALQSGTANPGVDAYVLGNKAGEATVTAVVYKANGDTATVTAKVTVKNDPISVAKFEHESSNDPGTITVGDYVWDEDYMDLTVIDQYGVEYEGQEITKFKDLLGIRFSVSDVEGATVRIDPVTGEIKAFGLNPGSTNYQFVVTATAPNGESVSTMISNN